MPVLSYSFNKRKLAYVSSNLNNQSNVMFRYFLVMLKILLLKLNLIFFKKLGLNIWYWVKLEPKRKQTQISQMKKANNCMEIIYNNGVVPTTNSNQLPKSNKVNMYYNYEYIKRWNFLSFFFCSFLFSFLQFSFC